MEQYKKEFIEFMIDCEVLKFGDFVTKSGRNTPFFVNTGFYRTGAQLRKLGEYYAKAIHAKFGTDFDVLFGPAYKGIPLTVATSMALSEMYGADIRYCSNRKEVKDHGDKGILLGSPIKDGDRVVIIEDVTTAGTSIQERKSTRLNSSHVSISYAVFCLKKKMKYNSVFDIIGPVMIGPSSSHTAGAARIGEAARTLFVMEPEWRQIHMHE